MKAGWVTKTLEDIADVKGGKRVPKGYKLQSEPTQHPYITVSDFSDDGTVDTSNIRYVSDAVFEQIKRYTISSNDLYLSIAGTIGKTGYVPPELDGASLTENACKLVFHSGISRDFIFYFTKTDDFARQAGTHTRIAAQPKLALERLKTITLPVPTSLSEQQRIVGILDEAFDGIATAKANAEQNRQNARALFESHLQAVFTQRGEGWEEKTLEEVCIIGDGNHSSNYPKKDELVESGVPFIRATNLVAGRISGDDMRFLSPQKHAQLKKGHLKTGDVLITNRGEIGKMAIVDPDYDNSNLNSQIAWLRCREGIDNKFLFHVLNSGDIQSHFQVSKSGAALQQFTIKQLKALKVPAPPKPLQQSIVSKLDILEEETQRLESIYQQKLAALDELKKSLLHQAFTGQL
jgi:type I restriction enzyme, S subunit